MGSWEVRTGLNVKPTLIARAKKRTGMAYVTDQANTWLIDGDPKLGDSYDTYEVYWETDVVGKARWSCTCVNSREYGKTCSHIVWAMLHQKGAVTSRKVEREAEEVPVVASQPQQPAVESQHEAPPGSTAVASPSPFVLSDYQPPMPDWLEELRPHQWEAITEILDWFRRGKKVVFLDAPTGSGKTLIGELVRREFSRFAIYSCTTKTLQDQVVRDYPYARVMKGRSNYPTADAPHAFPYVTADSCHTTQSGKCDDCQGASPHCSQCFIPSTIVSGPNYEKAMRRPWSGNLIKITTTGGHELTGTPNHPILTNRGWRQLGFIKVGDHIVGSRLGQEVPMSDPDVKHRPAPIGEIYSAAAIAAPIGDKGVPSIDVDLDVEGPHAEIEVVTIDGLLRKDLEGGESFLDPSTQHDLPVAYSETPLGPGDSNSPSGAERLGDSSTSSVGGDGVSPTLLGSHSGHSISVGLRAIADRYFEEDQRLLDQIIANPEVSAQFPHGLPAEVSVFEIVDRQKVFYSGHVYNLQTEHEWYYANGIVAHNCHPVDDCPYRRAKTNAELADLAVLNTAYFLAEGNTHDSRFGGRRKLAIIDEADELEDELMRHIEVVISKRALVELRIGPPDKKTVADSWVDWVEGVALPAVIRLVTNMAPMGRLDAKGRKRRTRYERLQERLERLVTPYMTDTVPLSEGWVYTGYDEGKVVFKPIRVDEFAGDVLWHLASNWLLMSATIISAEQMAADLGLDDDDWGLVKVESTFDPERRPIYVEPISSMTYKEMSMSLPPMLKRVNQIVNPHDYDRILIHTVSYKLAGEVVSSLMSNGNGRRVFTYSRARDREAALQGFLSHPEGIMVAPSFERGVDLHDDDCRVVIITKIPYPALGDKQISARLHSQGGNGWYKMNTVRALVQMTGRAMRSAEDSCEIYLLDAQFMRNVWRKSRQLLPAWWQEALKMGGSEILISLYVMLEIGST